MFGGEDLTRLRSTSCGPFTPALSPWDGEREKFQTVRVRESGTGTDEFEFSIAKLIVTIIGKAFNQQAFASHHLGEIERNIFSADTPRLRVTGQIHDFGRVKQRFRRHAAAQNAKTT